MSTKVGALQANKLDGPEFRCLEFSAGPFVCFVLFVVMTEQFGCGLRRRLIADPHSRV